MKNNNQSGLTVIETIIAITIGLLFIVAGSQIYGIIARASEEARDRSTALSLLTRALERYPTVYQDCPKAFGEFVMSQDEMPSSLKGATVSGNVTCVNGDPTLRNLNMTVNYYIGSKKYTVSDGVYY